MVFIGFIGCPLGRTGGWLTHTVCYLNEVFSLPAWMSWSLTNNDLTNKQSSFRGSSKFSFFFDFTNESDIFFDCTAIHWNQFHFVFSFSFYTIWILKISVLLQYSICCRIQSKKVCVGVLIKVINSIRLTTVVYSGIQLNRSSIHVSQLFCSHLLKLLR